MFPENITSEWWCDRQEAFAPQCDHIASTHFRKWFNVHTFQWKFLRCPTQPINNVFFGPLTRIWIWKLEIKKRTNKTKLIHISSLYPKQMVKSSLLAGALTLRQHSWFFMVRILGVARMNERTTPPRPPLVCGKMRNKQHKILLIVQWECQMCRTKGSVPRDINSI